MNDILIGKNETTAVELDPHFGTKRHQGILEPMAKQTVRTVGSQLGRQGSRGAPGGKR